MMKSKTGGASLREHWGSWLRALTWKITREFYQKNDIIFYLHLETIAPTAVENKVRDKRSPRERLLRLLLTVWGMEDQGQLEQG